MNVCVCVCQAYNFTAGGCGQETAGLQRDDPAHAQVSGRGGQTEGGGWGQGGPEGKDETLNHL